VIGVVILISDITKRVELDRVKTETLQLVSHELRNPLSSIQALSEVLLKFPVTPDKTKEMLTSIHDESKRLGETLNQYLDLSRLESGVRPIKVTMTEPAVLIDQCLRQHAVAANRKQIRLLMATDPILPRLAIDAGLIGIADWKPDR
jgi:two-component system sensor histidine kinase ResE